MFEFHYKNWASNPGLTMKFHNALHYTRVPSASNSLMLCTLELLNLTHYYQLASCVIVICCHVKDRLCVYGSGGGLVCVLCMF